MYYIIVHMKNGDKILSYAEGEFDRDFLPISLIDHDEIYLDNVIPLDDKPFREVARVFSEPWKMDFLEVYARNEKHDKGIFISREEIAAIQFIG